MRAVVCKNLLEQIASNASVLIAGDSFHHLMHVARIRLGEKVLVLDGNGSTFTGEVTRINKKNLIIEFLNSVDVKKNDKFHLAIGLPKKDSFEEVVRSCVEMGVCKIMPLITEYAQIKDYQINHRLEKIIESAMIQSNNPYAPELLTPISLKELAKKYNDYERVFAFMSDASAERKNSSSLGQGKCLYIVGPEGGFSKDEVNLLATNQKVEVIHLSIPILKTETAVCVGLGFLHGLSY